MKLDRHAKRGTSGTFIPKYQDSGMTSRSEYRIWVGMRVRCRDKNNREFHNYGGRGITVCDRWMSFENFLADMGPRPDGTTLDRVDADGSYCPENCRWADVHQQQRNRRNNHAVTAFGETKLLVEWTEDPRCKVTFGVLRQRLVKQGWSPEKAIATEVRKKLPNGQGPRHEQQLAADFGCLA